jgi:hypothetical protein
MKELDLPQSLFYGDSENIILTSYLNGASFIDDLTRFLMPPPTGIHRKIIGFHLLLTVGGPELSVYNRSMENAVASFTGLDDYSNLDGAAGLFSSRTATGSYNNRFSDLTVNNLADNEKTKKLGFLHFKENFHR